MAEAQLNIDFEGSGFERIHWSPTLTQVECMIDSKHVIIVKKTKSETVVVLKKGKLCMKIKMNMFESICDLKESIQLIQSFLEGNSA